MFRIVEEASTTNRRQRTFKLAGAPDNRRQQTFNKLVGAPDLEYSGTRSARPVACAAHVACAPCLARWRDGAVRACPSLHPHARALRLVRLD